MGEPGPMGVAGQAGLPSPGAPNNPLDCDMKQQATSELRQATCPSPGKTREGQTPACPFPGVATDIGTGYCVGE